MSNTLVPAPAPADDDSQTLYVNVPGEYFTLGGLYAVPMPVPVGGNISLPHNYGNFYAESIGLAPVGSPGVYESVVVGDNSAVTVSVAGTSQTVGSYDVATPVSFPDSQGVLFGPAVSTLTGGTVNPQAVVVGNNGYIGAPAFVGTNGTLGGTDAGNYYDVYANTGTADDVPGVDVKLAGTDTSTFSTYNELVTPVLTPIASGIDAVYTGTGIGPAIDAVTSGVANFVDNPQLPVDTNAIVFDVSVAALDEVNRVVTAVQQASLPSVPLPDMSETGFGGNAAESMQVAHYFTSIPTPASPAAVVESVATGALQNTAASLDGGFSTIAPKSASSALPGGDRH